MSPDDVRETLPGLLLVLIYLLRRAIVLRRPKPFVGLKDMDRREAEEELKSRLLVAGAQFSGLFPSSKEVGRMRQPHEHCLVYRGRSFYSDRTPVEKLKPCDYWPYDVYVPLYSNVLAHLCVPCSSFRTDGYHRDSS